MRAERLRQPALPPPPIRPAAPCADDPSALLEAHFRQVWQTRMSGLPFLNPALAVEAVGFVRHRGDWLGVVITPWFLNLLLISGGGELWGDIPAGERRYLELPCGALQFLADDDPDLGPYQYCPLIAPVEHLADMATARQAAADALHTVFAGPAVAPAPEMVPGAADDAAAVLPPVSPSVSRRGFFRHLAGKRN